MGEEWAVEEPISELLSACQAMKKQLFFAEK